MIGATRILIMIRVNRKQERDLPLGWLCCEEPLQETHDLKAQLFAVRAPKTPASVHQLDALTTLTRAPATLHLSTVALYPSIPVVVHRHG
jgi:hypothetical protein